jgi:repressor LexA
MQGLTDRQKQVQRTIYELYQESGHPPTVREIGKKLGLKSSCTVQRHLDALEKKGYIRRSPTKARSIEIVKSEDPRMVRTQSVSVPVVGTVAAGQPILAEENIEDLYALPRDLVGDEDAFMLKVKGESMIEDGLFDGDLVVVRPQDTAENGDIVVALLEDEATIKRFYREAGRVRLQPSNRTMQPIYVSDVAIVGKVTMAIRMFE